MFGVRDLALRKTLLQERPLTLEKSTEISAQHLKDLATATDPNEIRTLKLPKGKSKSTGRPKRFKGYQKMQILWRNREKMSGV